MINETVRNKKLLRNTSKPQYATAKSWDEIESHYLDLVANHSWDWGPVVELIRHIKDTDLSRRLFAFFGLGYLCISIYDPVEWNREALKIEFYGQKDGWHFTYRSVPNYPPTFERRYPTNKGIEKFDNFIKMIGW